MRATLLTSILFAVALLLITSQSSDAKTAAGLAWGTAPQHAKTLRRGNVKWYHTWAGAKVDGLHKLQYVPMLWGPSKLSSWHKRTHHFKQHKPKRILSFNEPDVPSQSNVSPKRAAELHMKYLAKWQRKGISVSSPQICYNVKWLSSFMKHLHNKGGHVDFIAVHYYGPATNMKRFKKYIRQIHKKWPSKSIWITEFGIMASSHPSQREVDDFLRKSMAWLNTQHYVTRAAFTGVFTINKPYDSFMSRLNAFMNRNGSLRTLGKLWLFGDFQYKRSLEDEAQLDAEDAELIEARAAAAQAAEGFVYRREADKLVGGGDVDEDDEAEAIAADAHIDSSFGSDRYGDELDDEEDDDKDIDQDDDAFWDSKLNATVAHEDEIFSDEF